MLVIPQVNCIQTFPLFTKSLLCTASYVAILAVFAQGPVAQRVTLSLKFTQAYYTVN